jgi:hypothetical protein
LGMRKGWIGFIDPMRDWKTGKSSNASLKNTAFPHCSDHPHGCAKSLMPNLHAGRVGVHIVKVDASECYSEMGQS